MILCSVANFHQMSRVLDKTKASLCDLVRSNHWPW